MFIKTPLCKAQSRKCSDYALHIFSNPCRHVFTRIRSVKPMIFFFTISSYQVSSHPHSCLHTFSLIHTHSDIRCLHGQPQRPDQCFNRHHAMAWTIITKAYPWINQRHCIIEHKVSTSSSTAPVNGKHQQSSSTATAL